MSNEEKVKWIIDPLGRKVKVTPPLILEDLIRYWELYAQKLKGLYVKS